MISTSVSLCFRSRIKVSSFHYHVLFNLILVKTVLFRLRRNGWRKSADVCTDLLRNFERNFDRNSSLPLQFCYVPPFYRIEARIKARIKAHKKAHKVRALKTLVISETISGKSFLSLGLVLRHSSHVLSLIEAHVVHEAYKTLLTSEDQTPVPEGARPHRSLSVFDLVLSSLLRKTLVTLETHENHESLDRSPAYSLEALIASEPTIYSHFNLKSIQQRNPLTNPKVPQIPRSTLLLTSNFSSLRHLLTLVKIGLSNDVEKNPGPDETALMITTYNVRGLGDDRKVRHLVNSLYKLDKGKNVDRFIFLQETFITKPGNIPFLWRGNLHLTPGTGNGRGCLTLLSPHLNVINHVNIDDRAHVLVCQRSSDSSASYIVANLYAPNANSNAKLDFYVNIFETVTELAERYDCYNILLAGDFNLIFEAKEAKNRTHTAQEKRMSNFVKDQARALSLADSWEKDPLFTWRRPNSDIFSTIDRILFTRDSLILKSCCTNWSLGYSDHAAVTAELRWKEKTLLPRSKITRLDPSLTRSEIYSREIVSSFDTMFSTMPQDWNPHLKLEFAKVCIRTVVERVQAERKVCEKGEEDLLNEELDIAIATLSEGSSDRLDNLIDHVEELRARKQILIDEKGTRLAERLGTKWYNEGEKSSKYFLRLLNRTLPDNFDVVQDDNGDIINNPKEVEEAIVNFYKGLYEQEEVIENEDNEFFNEIESVSAHDDASLAAHVTPEELFATLLTCKDTSPGPDGIPYSILKLLWPTYGNLLSNAWHYSLQTQNLPPSHKLSFLKLIPKVGKDLKRLTNWRPISLSNCDHKLITKTYSKRLCEKVAAKIGGQQTAYLKGRLINDNIRAILSSINLSNIEDNLTGLIVSLDAKKAFDSVSHKYIEKCLIKFGCHAFVPIFKTLYKNLKTDILINGRIVPGFLVKRGVKQGDALSCILFIMCMEPLLRNIENNPAIEAVRSNTLGNLPKTYAYADDVSCVMKDSLTSLQALFKEYERLTKVSGLELNAEKTELMRLGNNNAIMYHVSYKNQIHSIKSQDEVKINGIYFQRNKDAMIDRNVNSAIQKMDQHFKNWSRRSLSTLGKIVITKTFGISQIIYLLQSVTLKDSHFKQINAILYKFIWNRRYLAAKAPERIKRDIATKTIKYGGLGMLDVVELDESLKIKALTRMLNSNHPFLRNLNQQLDISSYFFPKTAVPIGVDSVLDQGIKLLEADRKEIWCNPSLNRDRNVLATIRELSIKSVVNTRGQGSIGFFRLWARGARKVRDLSLQELDSVRRHIEPAYLDKLRCAVTTNTGIPSPEFHKSYFTGSKHKPLASLTSKEIRDIRNKKEPIQEFKLGVKLTPAESRTWGFRLSKLTSTRHKNTILKALHGDIYTKDKLHRFGLTDSDACPRCDEKEDLKHKIFECDYARRIWDQAIPFLERLNTVNDPREDRIKIITATANGTSIESMTLTAEIIQSILQLKQEQNHLLLPKYLVLRAIKNLSIKEGSVKIRGRFIELLSEI